MTRKVTSTQTATVMTQRRVRLTVVHAYFYEWGERVHIIECSCRLDHSD